MEDGLELAPGAFLRPSEQRPDGSGFLVPLALPHNLQYVVLDRRDGE